ncbi:MAG: hypothetical protein GWP19_03345 [Planctomycetia bacterium]|nr:hypothetical protein [Planctomycetia bacterium]
MKNTKKKKTISFNEIFIGDNKEDRAKNIERAILLTWDSLSSHLQSTHTINAIEKKNKKEFGNYEFHKQCIRDYAETILILGSLY